MAVFSDSVIRLANDRDAFVEQLPQRIGAIEENWAELRKGDWQDELLEALYRRVREISEAASLLKLHQLSESSFSLEVYLSSFVGSESGPSASGMQEIDGLLCNLEAAAADSEKLPELTDQNGPLPIYLLGHREGELIKLADTLKQHQIPIRVISAVEELLLAIDEQLPAVIVADTAMLPQMSKLTAELARLKDQASVSVPLAFISASKNLQLRVDTIRAGGAAYFVTPLDAEDVAQRILGLGQPQKNAPYRVMVVEDDPTQAEFAGSILRKAGIQVHSVTDPMQVLDALRECSPELILMDIYMPGVNGIELTTIIRDFDEFIGIPIVFLSGEQNADRQMDALSVGGDDFVAKPIRPKQLLGVVENRIRRSRRLLKAAGSDTARDLVTGMLSRKQFLRQTEAALRSDPDPTAAVLTLSPDNIDELTRKLGIGGIDHLLAGLAKRTRQNLGPTDATAKLDDHTLGVLMRRESEPALQEAASQLQQQIAATPFRVGRELVDISVGVGLSRFDPDTDADSLLARSFTALEHALHSDPGTLHTHTLAGSTQTQQDDENNTPADPLSEALRACLDNNSFNLRYQPLLDLQTRGSENYEIIIRVPTVDGDLLQEHKFRDAAEQSGLAGEIDKWLLEKAIGILNKRQGSNRRTRLFLRQSASSMIDPNYASWLINRLRTQQMVGTGLILDFRLADLSRDIRVAKQNIAALREVDVEIALSRFSEKEAAFKVLRFVEANYINIARRLLKVDRSTISKVIELAHKCQAKVIVPNVDDPRSIDLHWSSGADFLQGDFIARPLEQMDYDFSQVVV